MSQSAHVLLISQDPTLQNLAEQVCRVCGYVPVSVEAVSQAESMLAQRGQHPFALVVIDLRVLGGSEADTLTQLPSLLQAWAAPPLHVPCLCLGSTLQKYKTLAVRSAPVPFLTIPFSAHAFGEAMTALVASDGGLGQRVDAQANYPPAGAHDAANQWLLPPPSASGVHRRQLS